MITLIVFFGLLFAGLPIVGAILAGALAFMATNDLAVLYDSVPIQFYGALEINSLLAIPLFLLVGEIMNKAGLTQRLIAVAEVLVGNLKGGLAYANLFTNAMAASILGSAVAQIRLAGPPARVIAWCRRRTLAMEHARAFGCTLKTMLLPAASMAIVLQIMVEVGLVVGVMAPITP